MKFGELVSGDYFRVLDVRPEPWRGFLPEEDAVRGRDAVVVLGHELWKTEFAARRDVIGKTVFLNSIAEARSCFWFWPLRFFAARRFRLASPAGYRTNHVLTARTRRWPGTHPTRRRSSINGCSKGRAP